MSNSVTQCIDCGGDKVRTAFARSPKDCNYVVRTEEPLDPSDSRYVILRCEECGSVFLHPHYFKESFAVYNEERYFTGYFPDNIHTGGGPILTPPLFPSLARQKHKQRAASILKLAGFRAGGNLRVIDIGCAKGDLVRGFSDCGCEASGSEISDVSVSEARKRGLKVLHGFFEDQRFPANHFDLIVSTETFEHMADIGRITSKIHDTLKPNGALVIQVPNDIEGFRSSFYSNIWWMIPPMHIRYFTAESIKNIFARHGLRFSSMATTGSFGGDMSLILGWILRKGRMHSLQSSSPFRVLIQIIQYVFLPVDKMLNTAGRHSELIVVMRRASA